MAGFYGGSPIEYAAINQLGSDAVAPSASERIGAAFDSGLAANLTPRLLRAQQQFIASPEEFPESLRNFAAPRSDSAIFSDLAARDAESAPDPMLDPETANAEYGIKGVLNFDKPIPQSVAKELADRKREKIQREDIVARSEGGPLTGGAALGAGLAAGLLDPINVAAGFIPFIGEARMASLLGRGAVEAMGVGERAGARVLTGAGQGALSMTALQPLEFGLSRQEHEDYTMADALRSIALGTVLGGGLHAGVGTVADRVTGRYANPITQRLEDAGPQEREGVLQGALAQTIEGRPVDVAPALSALPEMPAAERSTSSRAYPTVEDPMTLMQRGELTADRAEQIAGDLKSHFEGVEKEIFGDEAETLRRLRRQSDAAWNRADDRRAHEIDAQIAEIERKATSEDMGYLEGIGGPAHLDPEGWRDLSRELRDAEGSREDALSVVAGRLRDLPADAPKTESETEAVAVIGRALQTEAERGGDLAQFIQDAARERFDRYGGGRDAQEVVEYQLARLRELMKPRPVSPNVDPRLIEERQRLIARHEPDDGLRAQTDAESFLKRPSDEFQAIQKQIDDLEAATAKPKPAEPVEGAAQQQAAAQAPAEMSAAQQVAAEADGRAAAVQRAASCIVRGFG